MASESTPAKSATRVAVVGCGQVGGAVAFALILDRVADELLLVDSNIERRDGQLRDLTDVAYSCDGHTRVLTGSYHEAGQCDVIVLAAGCKYTTGATTVENVSRNISVVREVVNAMRPLRHDAILVVVANPVDLLTSVAGKLSRLPPAQVIGSGTLIDSVRLRGLLADRVGVAVDSVHINVLGVQGDHQVVSWSTATVGGAPVDKVLSPESHGELESECLNRSRAIIRAKGSTPFGVGSVVADVCRSVLRDRRSVRPVSHFQEAAGCWYSLPAILGRTGAVTITPPLQLSSGEEAAITRSAGELKVTVDRIIEHGHRS